MRTRMEFLVATGVPTTGSHAGARDRGRPARMLTSSGPWRYRTTTSGILVSVAVPLNAPKAGTSVKMFCSGENSSSV